MGQERCHRCPQRSPHRIFTEHVQAPGSLKIRIKALLNGVAASRGEKHARHKRRKPTDGSADSSDGEGLAPSCLVP